MKVSRFQASIIRHRKALQIVACGPHRNGRYSAYLLLPPAGGGYPLARSEAVYGTAQEAIAGFKGTILAIARFRG
jgi:hypothetical protein